MTLRDYLKIDLTTKAQRFEIELGGKLYNMGFNYNQLTDSYTVDLFDDRMKPIILGERLVYGMRLWAGINNDDLPLIDLIPFDESGLETAVTMGNLNKTVYLFIDDVGGGADGN